MSKKDKTSSNLNKNKRINLEVQQCQCVLFESCIHCTTVQEFKQLFSNPPRCLLVKYAKVNVCSFKGAVCPRVLLHNDGYILQ